MPNYPSFRLFPLPPQVFHGALALALAAGVPAAAQDFDVETDTSVVEFATGTGRGVYVPLDEALILPRLRGLWASSPDQCAAAGSAALDDAARMKGVQIVGANTIYRNGETWRATATFIAAAEGGAPTARFADRRNDIENLLVFQDGTGAAERRMLMYLTPGGRLAEEEVGERRAILVPCPVDAAAIEDFEARRAATGTAVLTYQATIAPADTVNSVGGALADVAGILQQDRFNVDVRGIRQGFDTPDALFTDKAKRTALGRAAIDISPALEKRVLAGGVSVQVAVREAGGDGGYRVQVTPAPVFEMPEAFRGRWAGSREACTTGGALSILTMDATGLHQAEGAMAVKSLVVDPDDPRRITLETDNTGGGETWIARHEVTLSPDDGTMAFKPLDADAGPLWTLYRCG